MKKTLLILAFLISLQIKAQEDKTVTLTVSGTGKTIEEAKTNALRSAIEQAFGAFISSKTEILNDNLVKDEIVSVANGNIQKFDIISQVEIPNNGYAMTLNATVSISKLTSFAQSKGVSIEVKGGLFAANIIQQELNEKAELISLQNILNTSNELLKKSFDYSIETKGNPTLNNGKYDIPLKITIKLNKNFYEFRKYFIKSLSGLTMNESEIANYEEIKKPIGQLILRRDSINFQESLLSKKIQSGHDYNYVDINRYDENTELVMSYDNYQIIVINSNEELKRIYKKWSWFTDAPLIYKVKKEDLGYSKIFFRNPSSMVLLNNYFDNIKNIIINFEVSNNIEVIRGEDLLNFRRKFPINYFNVVLKNSFLKNSFGYYYDEKSKSFYKSDDKDNFIAFGALKHQTLDYFLHKQTISMKEYFPNLLSALPLKLTSKIILASFSKFQQNDIITTFDFTDTKSLEQLKQLSEYKIKPID